MSKTDFFDDDLVQQRETAKRIKMGAGDEASALPPAAPSDTLPTRVVGDLNLTRMARHREEVEDQVARTTEELERLRQRQEDLERERRTLQDLRSRQDEFERGRRELMDRFGQAILTLERDEVRAEQAAELLATTRQRFRTILAEIQDLEPEKWQEDQIREELGKALAVMEDARVEHKKAISRIEALRDRTERKEDDLVNTFDQPVLGAAEIEKTFGYWLKAGFAFCLPLIVTALLLTLATLAFMYGRY